jgi:hypothetical protein
MHAARGVLQPAGADVDFAEAASMRRRVLAALACSAACGVRGRDDGLATSPPMGWRSWNQFGLDINQSLLEQQCEAGRNRYGVQGRHLNPLGFFLNPPGFFLRTSIYSPDRVYGVF